MQERAPPVPPTDEEAEGTAAHLVAMMHAAGHGESYKIGDKFNCGGREWTIDADMWAAARMYAKACGPVDTYLRLEDPVSIQRVHETDCWGTPDAWKYWPNPAGDHSYPSGIVRIVDFKYGHRYVEEFENSQLVAYAAGVLERLNLPDMNITLELVIVQPRSFHRNGPVRTWRVRAVDIRTHVNELHAAAHEALKPNPPLKAGRHCLDCKARLICPALQTLTYDVVEYATTGEPLNMPVDAMGRELRILEAAAEVLEARREALHAHLDAVARSGQRVAHWSLQPGRSTLKWNDDVTVEELRRFGEFIKIPLVKPQEPITPRQAIDAGIDENVIVGQYAHRSPAKLHLKPNSTTEFSKVFGADNA
jgi:hypothetical protein